MEKKLLKVIPHLAFCGLVIWCFVNNSFLRPIACGALYKEYIVATLVLGMAYLNYLVLIPRLLFQNKQSLYWKISILNLFMVVIVEILLVSSNINPLLRSFCSSQKEFIEFITKEVFLISLRDAAFVALFYIIAHIEKEQYTNLSIAQLILKKFKSIPVSDNRRTPLLLHINQVVYFNKIGNYLQIHTLQGDNYYLYGSLKKLAYMDNLNLIRISRNITVAGQHIISFNKESVTLASSNNDSTTITLSISPSHYDKIEPQLQRFAIKNQETRKQTGREHYKKTNEKRNTARKSLDKKDLTSEKDIEKAIHQYIADTPLSNAPHIAENLHIPLRTVQRILEIFKQKGIVRHEGSKKTGGYVLSRTKAKNKEHPTN